MSCLLVCGGGVQNLMKLTFKKGKKEKPLFHGIKKFVKPGKTKVLESGCFRK